MNKWENIVLGQLSVIITGVVSISTSNLQISKEQLVSQEYGLSRNHITTKLMLVSKKHVSTGSLILFEVLFTCLCFITNSNGTWPQK